MAYNVSNGYKDIIYSQEEQNQLKILFNNVELTDADLCCEKLTVTSRIIPSDGNKVFGLNSFIAKEAELILHENDDFSLSDVEDQVNIQVGTLVSNSYEYVPLGIFNIQDTPTSDKGKITIKLRDNAVKFDFGYNAQTLIDQQGGSATLMQILQDICTQAGVTCGVTSFTGENITTALYDNSVNARTYVSYIAEQAGLIATIDRTGQLIFVDLNQSSTWEIPLEVVEKYELGTSYDIERVVYESGIIKYETSNDDTLSTLYINAANPYIGDVSQLNSILTLFGSFEIDSVTTGKILGNPAIDPYDYIEIKDGNTTVFKTLANQVYTYSGNHRQTFETEIGKEQRTENVSLKSSDTFKKWAKTTIDSMEGTVEITTGKVNSLETTVNNNYQEIITKFEDYVPENQFITLENSVTQLQTDTYTKTEINTKLTDGSVTKVMTTSGTFDENGMTYAKTNAKTKTTINEVGINVKDTSDSSLLFAGYVDSGNTDYADYVNQTIVGTENIIVKNYLNVGDHLRIQNYTDENSNEGTGFFFM